MRKKNSRQRGSHTHGWGAKKKHRGKGNKGGAGNAGTGKRGDANKPSIWTNKKFFGKYGFTPRLKNVCAINIQYLNEMIDSLVSKKFAEKNGDVYVIDLAKIRIKKLLSKGIPSKKFEIKVEMASPSVIESVKAAGGSVTLTAKPKDAKSEAKSEKDAKPEAKPAADKPADKPAEKPAK